MKKTLWAVALFIPVVSSLAATSITVNKSGSGNYTNIQDAIASTATNGATLITITDSGHYVENLQIGDQDAGGTALTLTSNQSGTNRPVITPSANKLYVNSARPNQQAGFAVFANNTVISNLVIEAQPDITMGGMFIMAQNVRVESCQFRIVVGTLATLGASVPLLYFGQEGDGTGALTPGTNPKPGGRDSNGCLVRNSEFIGTASDSVPYEPVGLGRDSGGIVDGSMAYGYLGQRSAGDGTGQGSGYVRMDHVTDGQDVFVTFEGCWFHHDRDYGIFPTDNKNGAGSVNVVVKKCRFDAQGKFQVRGRGANVFVESSVFTRANQVRNNDNENSAVAVNANNDGFHVPTGSVSNCLFVNCGSADAQTAYYGGVNAHRGSIAVTRSTFVDCMSGVTAGRGGVATLSVSNSIFHQIGDNVVPAIDANGATLTNGSPDLIGGLYPAWTNGLPNFGATKWSAVFNRFTDAPAQIIIDNCMVGTIDSEDSRTWDQALLDGTVLGCRLYAGYDTNFVGTNTVIRGTPVFANTDPDAPNAYQLTAGSPGQGLGADLAPLLSPQLVTSVSGNQLTISWAPLPIWINGILKSAPAVNGAAWAPVAGVTNNSVTITIGAGNQYYALLKP